MPSTPAPGTWATSSSASTLSRWRSTIFKGANEAPVRAGVYQAVWGQLTLDLAGYQRMQQAPDYRPELDVVVVAPSGDFVAFCQCWFDSVNQTGLIEPMGTVAAFRRAGYGRAALALFLLLLCLRTDRRR